MGGKTNLCDRLWPALGAEVWITEALQEGVLEDEIGILGGKHVIKVRSLLLRFTLRLYYHTLRGGIHYGTRAHAWEARVTSNFSFTFYGTHLTQILPLSKTNL